MHKSFYNVDARNAVWDPETCFVIEKSQFYRAIPSTEMLETTLGTILHIGETVGIL